ncbi:MAG: hypothetical protein MK108_02965 [Mariniblastus sp.]|nr:hypothetical protein [Mariniblastus sp.]
MLQPQRCILFVGWALLWGAPAAIAQPDRDATVGQPAPQAFPVQTSVDDLLTKIILQQMPLQYTDDRKWGVQEKRWDGIKFRTEGIKLETKRRWKMVNHGTWRKYQAHLVNPEREFSIEMTNLRNTPGGKTAFDLKITANLDLQARQAKWVKGVQLYSVSAEGSCQVRIRLSCQSEIQLDLNHLPPDLILKPRITQAELSVDEFRIDRISKVGGEVAQQVTRWARGSIDEKVREEEAKLVTKLNAQLEKNQDDLRLSLHDALQSRWIKQSVNYLPQPVQGALQAK